MLVNPNTGYDPNTYPTVLDTMYDQGQINLKAFSVYLDSKDAKAGTIIFGGIDEAKYTGELVQIAMAPRVTSADRPIYDSLAIYLTSINLANGTQGTALTPEGMVEHVSLDTGASLSHIPVEAATKLYDALGAFDDTKESGGETDDVWIDCSWLESSTTIDFGFSDGQNSAHIRVPIKEVVWTSTEFYGERRTVKGLSCMLGIKPSIQGASLLGDTFLRSAYVVYDLSNNVIALAPMNPNPTEEKIVDFKETDTILPGVKNVVTLVSVAETTTFWGGWRDVKSGTRVRNLTPATTTTGSQPAGTDSGSHEAGNGAAATTGPGVSGTSTGAGATPTNASGKIVNSGSILGLSFLFCLLVMSV